MTEEGEFEVGDRALFRTDDDPMGRARAVGEVVGVDGEQVSIIYEGQTFVRDAARCRLQSF